MQQSFDQPGLGDDGVRAPDAAISPDGGADNGSDGDKSGDTTVSRCGNPETPPVEDAGEARSRRVPTDAAVNAEEAQSHSASVHAMSGAGEANAHQASGPAHPKAGGKGGAKGAGKRERILRAAMELFAERDFHRVLMDDVAARAGVGKGTLYRYFETKEDLFVAVLSFAVDTTAERLRAKLERLDDPVEQLRFACLQALRFFRENDHLFHILYHRKALGSEEARAELGEKKRGLRHFAEHIIAEGNVIGVFDVEDAGFASTILWGMIRTALRTAPSDGPLDELAGKITGLFTNGIAKR